MTALGQVPEPFSGPGKRVAVLQSNYIPWKGYFDIVNNVDLFIFYDDLQFTKNDRRNRNRIKAAQGPEWISIPVRQDMNRLICEVELPPRQNSCRLHRSKSTTLSAFLDRINHRYGQANRIWVMDCGIPTEGSLAKMRSISASYLVGTDA